MAYDKTRTRQIRALSNFSIRRLLNRSPGLGNLHASFKRDVFTSSKCPSAETTNAVADNFSPTRHNDARLSRKALPITETELKLIAAAAIIGLRRIPKNG